MNVDFLNFLFIYYGEIEQIFACPRSTRRVKECTWHLRAEMTTRHLQEVLSASTTITPE
jgi:hypothetical protein